MLFHSKSLFTSGLLVKTLIRVCTVTFSFHVHSALVFTATLQSWAEWWKRFCCSTKSTSGPTCAPFRFWFRFCMKRKSTMFHQMFPFWGGINVYMCAWSFFIALPSLRLYWISQFQVKLQRSKARRSVERRGLKKRNWNWSVVKQKKTFRGKGEISRNVCDAGVKTCKLRKADMWRFWICIHALVFYHRTCRTCCLFCQAALYRTITERRPEGKYLK